MKSTLRAGLLCSLAAAISACTVANSSGDPPVNSLAAVPAAAAAKRLQMVPRPLESKTHR